MALLLLDQLRRFGGHYAVVTAFVALTWTSPFHRPTTHWVVAWSLVVAFFIGALRSHTIVTARETAFLPVSWPERWRAQWLVAVAGPLVVIGVGQIVGAGIAAAFTLPQGTPDAVVLSLLFSAAYVGFAAALPRLVRWRETPPATPPRPRDPRVFWLVMAMVWGQFLLMVLGGLSGFLFYRFLPNDLSALRGLSGVVIAAGITLGVWSWFSWSVRKPHLYLRVGASAGTPSVALENLPRPQRPASGARALFEFALVTACRRSLVFAAFATPCLFLVDRNLVKSFWVSLVLLLGSIDWQTRLRPLRQLPISLVTLNLVMISTTATLWFVTLGLMKAAGVVAPSKFDAVPAALFLSVAIAVTVLVDSVRLRNRRSDWAVLMGLVLAARFVPNSFWAAIPSVTASAVPFLGLAAVAVAAAVNHHTLTRSDTAYKSRPVPASPFATRA